MDLQNLVNNVKRFGLNVAENFVSVPKESKFRESGVLTPEEFVAAGDHLVHHCPTWKWAKCGDPKKFRDWLPEDKQFLITKNVPCHKRCRQLMAYDPSKEKILSWNEVGAEDGFAGDEDSGWVDTHHGEESFGTNSSQAVDIGTQQSAEPEEDEDAIMDLDDFADSGELDNVDPNRFVVQKKEFMAEVEKPRTYDLHICYDLYYRVPRLFLIGYAENRQPLTIDQTNEDFSVDHANKTITFEPHTSLDCDMPSVHPCRHAETMKRLMDQYAENGKDLAVHEYLLIFLKFVQAVIPTIEYDFTRSIKL